MSAAAFAAPAPLLPRFTCSRAATSTKARALRPAAPSRARATPAMALRAVESYDGAFGLDADVREALVRLLTDPEFAAGVAKQGIQCESVFFTGDLFQPVPYSPATPLGMPRDMEVYARDVEFAVINIPPSVMFEARCFKPSRLCAVFKRFGIDPEERRRFQEQLKEMELRAERNAMAANESFSPPADGEDAWDGLGTLIKKGREEDDWLDEATERELDELVV